MATLRSHVSYTIQIYRSDSSIQQRIIPERLEQIYIAAHH